MDHIRSGPITFRRGSKYTNGPSNDLLKTTDVQPDINTMQALVSRCAGNERSCYICRPADRGGHLLERWVSGLNQQFAKLPYWVNRYRGFESPPLRQ